VADTRASPAALELLAGSGSRPRRCPFVPDADVSPELERYEFEILPPDVLHSLLLELERSAPPAELAPEAWVAVRGAAARLREQYCQAFERHGPDTAAEWQFRRILEDFRREVTRHAPQLQQTSDAVAVLGSMFTTTNRRPQTHARSAARPSKQATAPSQLVRAGWFELVRAERSLDVVPKGQREAIARLPAHLEPILDAFGSPCTEPDARQRLAPRDAGTWQRDLALLQSWDLLTTPGTESLRFDRPLFVVSAPRAGSTLLFELLAELPNVYTVGGESHGIIEGLPPLHPRSRGYASNALGAEDAPEWLSRVLRMRFARLLLDRNGKRATEGGAPSLRMLEKTPKNALRIPFLARVFPDARFIFLQREAPANLGSLIEGWRSGRFVTYPELPGWRGMPWSFLLTPGWQGLSPHSLPSIAAEQWAVSNTAILDALEALPRERWIGIDYAELTGEPRAAYERLASWAELPVDAQALGSFEGGLPLSSFTLSLPARDKWKRYEADIDAVLPRVATTCERLRNVAAVPNISSSWSR
ncbi:MAG TPA: sulfotransferase, partial [Polyangiaceae bacterium]|nr:sulfotransferase [Polyangiaceae bacterium]